VRRSANLLLTRTLSGCLSSLIRRPSLSLLQLIQIVINTLHLEDTNIFLENFISELTGAGQDATHVARLQARSMFKDIRAEGEEYIYKKLVSKMDEFLELANYDWMMADPTGQASPWLMDLIAFLKSVFESFTNLPPRLAQMACMSSCQHLARSVMALLTQVKQVVYLRICVFCICVFVYFCISVFAGEREGDEHGRAAADRP
jgi:hypothetical protein